MEYDVAQMQIDMAAKGWQPVDVSRRAKVAASSVTRFLNGEVQTARMAKKISKALGFGPEHYIVRRNEAVA